MELTMFSALSAKIPAALLCLLFVITIILLSQFGLSLFNKTGLNKRIIVNNEIAGVMFGAISLIYSLVLAFVFVAVWEDYEDLKKSIQEESDKMNSIIVHSSAMPDSIRTPVYQALYNYCNIVMQDEWGTVNDNLGSQSSAIPYLRMMLQVKHPQNELQNNTFAVISDDLSQISELRRSRLSHVHSRVPDIVWLVLQVGTVLLIVFSFLFNVESIILKRIYLSFFSGFLALCLFLILSLDNPFNSYLQIDKQPYVLIQKTLEKDYSVTLN